MTVHEHYRYPEAEPPRYTCRVCGYPGLPDLPVGSSSGREGMSCPSCGFRFGHTDTDLHYTYEQWRDVWVNQGMSWTGADIQPPAGWAPARQLAHVAPERPGRYTCLVCGYPDLTRPYGDFLHPTYEICPCCGYQYGYDDHYRSPINWRTAWIEEDGMRWWAHGGPPGNWDPHRQLTRLDALPRNGQVNGVSLNSMLAYF
jgi:transcription elongation factor Elf1